MRTGPGDAHAAGATLRAERPEDRRAVAELVTRAFGDDGVVAGLVDALRAAEAPLPSLSLVATLDGEVVGHVMLTAGRLDAPRRLVDVLVLSPLAVDPPAQGRGIGTALVRRALTSAEAAGVPLVFVEGSPAYYGRRGFDRADELGFRSPSLRIPPAAFQVARCSRYQPWMTGTLVYSEPFWAHDCVGLRDPTA